MKYLRLFKYPGAKTSLLRDILRIVKAAQPSLIIDVFGGSGLVSLNSVGIQVVYNDIDPVLVNMFRMIQRHPEEMMRKMKFLLDRGTMPGGTGYDKKFPNTRVVRDGKALRIPDRKGNPVATDQITSDQLESAFTTLYRFNTSFGGLGNTYATRKEKASASYLRKTVSDLPEMSRRISSWKIENMDFRDLIKKYDSADSFFYLDPPYPGKQWYNVNFQDVDFRDLYKIIHGLKANYLLNVDWDEPIFLKIFGRPSFVKVYENANGRSETAAKHYRRKSFYTNVMPGGKNQH
jgi:DNA adenine methylase